VFFGCECFGCAVSKFPKAQCGCTDIVLYIQLGSERLPICKNCWFELAELTEDWNEHKLNV
jgi:hypothetical protein